MFDSLSRFFLCSACRGGAGGASADSVKCQLLWSDIFITAESKDQHEDRI